MNPPMVTTVQMNMRKLQTSNYFFWGRQVGRLFGTSTCKLVETFAFPRKAFVNRKNCECGLA